MKRRAFLRKAGAAAVGAIGMPYLLPSGRLFARTQSRLADHVVVVLFAGGVRQQEAVEQRYLDGSQNEAIPGNILYNLLNGDPPEQKIVYGTDASLRGEIPIPRLLNQTLQQQGTLFREMRATLVGHYGGLNVALQGNTLTTQGLRQKPLNPTIFEYVRRHAGEPASKVWFVGNGIGNSVPLLNHSTHPEYGQQYAANFLAPQITFGELGFKHLSKSKVYHPEYELDPIYKMKYFLDNVFENKASAIGGIRNTPEEKLDIKNFLEATWQKTANGTITQPPVNDINDLSNIGYACEVMKWFKPTLTVVNLNNVDTCHGNFTTYLRNLHRIDHGVGFMWDYIQRQIPEMSNNTILLLVPECGRNLQPNPILDENDWYGYDHSDANARRIFGMMVGPNVPQNLTRGSVNNSVGESADIAPTVAEILGIKDTVIGSGLLAGSARSLFDRI
ncbi:MAG: hypothetical protein AAGI38_00995 [Bacteroidota bacterium]